MKIELQPAVQIQSLDYLQKTFLPGQRSRRDRVMSVIEDGSKRLEEIRKSIAANSPKGIRQANGNILSDPRLENAARAIAQHQTAEASRKVRAEVDAVAVPTLREMATTADQAKVYAERHWDLWSVLRRAKGLRTGTSGIIEAMQLRAAYAETLRGCDALELGRWAQQAIDEADPILADAVARENLVRNARPFSNAALSERLAVPDYTAAQKLLGEVVFLHKEAETTYFAFGKNLGQAATRKIALGLARQGNVEVDDAGGLRTIPVLRS